MRVVHESDNRYQLSKPETSRLNSGFVLYGVATFFQKY